VTPVDPDRAETEPLRRDVVVVQALRDVEDPLGPDAVHRKPLQQRPEVPLVRLVRADLLGGDDPVEVNAKPAIRRSEQVVIAVRQDAEAKAGPKPNQRVVGVGKRRPVGNRAAECRRGLRREWPSQA